METFVEDSSAGSPDRCNFAQCVIVNPYRFIQTRIKYQRHSSDKSDTTMALTHYDPFVASVIIPWLCYYLDHTITSDVREVDVFV